MSGGLSFKQPVGDADAGASNESALLEQGRNLDREAAVADHSRSQGLKSAAYHGTVLILWAMMLAILAGIVALAWHTLAPSEYRWLSAAELQDLKTLLGVFLVSGLLADNARRLLSR